MTSYVKTLILLIILIFPMTVGITAHSQANSQGNSSPIPIIFDEAHLLDNDRYSLSNFDHQGAMNKSLEILKQVDQNGDLQADYNIVINSDYFSATGLAKYGSSGVIIETLLDRQIGNSEGKAIKEWVEAGGSVFLSTQPDYNHFGYSKAHNTNLFLKKLGLTSQLKLYEFGDSSTGYNSDELYDNISSHLFSSNGNPTNLWDIVVTQDQFTNTPFGTFIKQGINKVLLGVSSLEVNNSELVGAYSWPESYSVSDVTGEKRLINDAIPWIASAQLGKGKVVLLGSTFPIADWQVYGTTLSFIDQLDNKRLWLNIINWLIQQEGETSTIPSSTGSSTSPTTSNGFLFYVMVLSLVSVTFFQKKSRKNN